MDHDTDIPPTSPRRRRWLAPALLLALSGLGLGAALHGCGAHQAPGTVHSPSGMRVERVVLFQNGMAYVERRGAVDQATVDLRTTPEGMHDVLKSLSVVDHEGGTVRGVRVLDEGARLQIALGQEGSEDLSIAYVAEASGWRPTYRIVDQGEGRVRLQGLAVVDNPSGEDWSNVRLALSTEVPLAFRYEVGTARVAQRPTLGSDGLLQVQLAQPILQAAPREGRSVQNAYGVANVVGNQTNQRAGQVVGARNALEMPEPPNGPPAAASPATTTTNAMSAIDARDPAEGFTLDAPERVTLGAGESGLVPFVDQSTTGGRVLLYKPAPVRGASPGASHRHPYHAVMFHNPVDAPLLTGPVTVYADGSFQGDGVTAAIPANAHAFVAYALSPSVHVEARRAERQAEIRGVSVTGGRLRVRLRRVVEHRFDATGERHGRRLYAFASKEEGFEPEDLPEGSVVTPAGVFLPVDGESATLRLVQPHTQTVDLTGDPRHAFVPALLELVEAQGQDAGPLRAIVDRLEAIDHEHRAHQRDLEVHERALVQRREALHSLRDVPGNTPLRRRLGQGVAEGVRAVDASTRAIVSLEAERVALRQDWYAHLRALDL